MCRELSRIHLRLIIEADVIVHRRILTRNKQQQLVCVVCGPPLFLGTATESEKFLLVRVPSIELPLSLWPASRRLAPFGVSESPPISVQL